MCHHVFERSYNVRTTHIMSCCTLSTQHTHNIFFHSLIHSSFFLPVLYFFPPPIFPLSLSPHHYPLLSSDVMCFICLQLLCGHALYLVNMLMLNCGKCVPITSSSNFKFVYVHVCVCVCVCVCVHACVRVCVHVCMRACVCEYS